VNQQNIDVVDSKSSQTFLDPTQNAITRPIGDELALRRHTPSDLSREDNLIAWYCGECCTDEAFATTYAIHRGRIDQPQPGINSVAHRVDGLRVRAGNIQSAPNRSTTKTEAWNHKTRAANGCGQVVKGHRVSFPIDIMPKRQNFLPVPWHT
jgi:hypothetical protein